MWEKWKYKWRHGGAGRFFSYAAQYVLFVSSIHPACATASALSLTLLGMRARSILPRRPYHCPPALVSCAGHWHWEPTMANLCSFDILCHLCVWYAATSLCLICCTIFGCSSTVPCVRALCWNTFVLHPGFCSGLWYAETPTTMPPLWQYNGTSFFGSVVRLPWDAPSDSGMANLCT